MEQVLVRGVAHDLDQVKMTVRRVPDKPGIAAKIFSTLAEKGINVDMIVQNVSADEKATDLTFTVGKSDLDRTLKLLENAKSELGFQRLISASTVVKVQALKKLKDDDHLAVRHAAAAALAELVED